VLSNILKTKDIAMIVALAFSTNVAGQILPTNNSSNKSYETKLFESKSLSELISMNNFDTTKYEFSDHKFILDKYEGIPARNLNNPVYETLLFDKNNNYFCYIFPQDGEGLRAAFKKSYKILMDNGVDDQITILDEKNLPDIFPDKPPRGSINQDFLWAYKVLSEALLSEKGHYIYRAWDANNHRVAISCDKKEYMVKIHK
jgi:hypothetical protein